ncbi:MAG: hypothetical protein GX262_00445 [Clostridia bacterium]|nr:hypothetical protein [Clostridia bacterium]
MMAIQIHGDLATLWSNQPMTAALRLQAGETVRAVVRDVTDQEVLLLIRGQQVPAQTDTQLEVGQRVNLRVQEVRDGRVVFQVVQEDRAQGQAQSGSRNPAEALLLRHGLTATSGNLLLAQTLLETGKGDISKEGLLFLSRALSSNPSPTEVQTLVQLFAKGLPVGKSHVSALQAFIQTFMENNLSFTGAGESQSLVKAIVSLPEGAKLLEGLSIAFGENGKEIAGKLAQFQERLGLNYEFNLRNNLEGQAKAPASPASNPGDGQETVKITTVKEALLNLLQLQTVEGTQTSESLLAARTLLQVLTGLQLLHLGQGEQGQLYLMGWLNWFGELENSPFFLSFFQDEKGGSGPGEPSRQIMLKTYTPRLGSIIADLRFFRRQLTVQVAVDNEPAQKVFNRYTDKLLAMMEGLPWMVQVLPCRLSEPRETGQWLQQYVEPITPQTLDVRL